MKIHRFTFPIDDMIRANILHKIDTCEAICDLTGAFNVEIAVSRVENQAQSITFEFHLPE